MFGLALRSVRQRPGRFLATLLSAFLGAAIVMAFNSLHDTAGSAHVDHTSAETLSTTASVVGGYGTLLVFFAIASTLTVNVRQRTEEINLLRCTGATPAQIKRMVVGEAAVVALAGALLAIGPAMLGGRVLVGMFQDSGQVAGSVDYTFGPIALMSGLWITLLASVGAAFLAVRRATRALSGGRPPRTRLRTVGGVAALVLGTGSVLSTYAMHSTDQALMAAPAYGAILLSVGFATFSPALLRVVLGALARPLAALGGAGGYLAVHTLRRRSDQLASILMPLILFTGVATATLVMQAIESDAVEASGLAKSVDAKNLETINLTVVGIIVAFALIMLVNSLYAATSYRTGEFGTQRLTGATPRQVLGSVRTEGVFLTATGLFFGTVAALAGILPFHTVRTDAGLPGDSLGIWLAIAAVATTATLLTSVGTARRSLRTPAVVAAGVTG